MEAYIIDIDDEKKKRDKHIKRIKKYLDTRNRPKTLDHIKAFLAAELSCRFIYQINLEGQLVKMYTDPAINYSPFTIRLYFPKKNLCICCSQDFAERHISIIPAILSQNYEETTIEFRYYDKYLKKVCISGKLLILMIEPKSIMLNNGKDLETFIQESL